MTQKIVLFCVGSYNPPTFLHLRIFELARDYLHKLGPFRVIGGIMSPVHDAYGKKDLVNSSHRVEMVKRSLMHQSFIKLSTWESSCPAWSTTRSVLDYHQGRINGYLEGTLKEKDSWFPDSISRDGTPVKIKLLCGADVLESFNVPNLWQEDDMRCLSNDYGMVVISRSGSDPNKSIYDSDILTENQGGIIQVREWFTNEISSTKVRRAIRRKNSVRYIIPDPVIEYVENEKLYQ